MTWCWCIVQTGIFKHVKNSGEEDLILNNRMSPGSCRMSPHQFPAWSLLFVHTGNKHAMSCILTAPIQVLMLAEFSRWEETSDQVAMSLAWLDIQSSNMFTENVSTTWRSHTLSFTFTLSLLFIEIYSHCSWCITAGMQERSSGKWTASTTLFFWCTPCVKKYKTF